MLALNRRYLPFVMWIIPLLFFAYQFILRIWPGLMMQSIMEQFSISASQFGMIAAFYYYGYAGMQIPLALLLDRFSVRYIVFISASLCGLATLMFTFTDNFVLALISRFLIGAGSAIGFLGVSKVVSQWFPRDQYAKMIGFSFTIGLLGAIYGGKPLSLLIETYSSVHVAVVLACISIVIGFITYLVLREPDNKPVIKQEQQFKLQKFAQLLSSPTIWCLAISNLLMVGALEGFADVWGVQYLIVAYGMQKSVAAGITSMIFIGMLFGGPLLAMISKRYGNYSVIVGCGLSLGLAFCLLLLNNNFNNFVLSGLFLVIGILCCYQVIVFAAGANIVEPKNLGITVAFLNCINMFGGSFFHTLIGITIDLKWVGEYAADGIKIYELSNYQMALSVIPLCAVIGAGLAALVAVLVWYKNSSVANTVIKQSL